LTVVDDGQATVFNEPGPRVTPGEWTALRDRFAELLGAAEAVVLSGSLPPGLPPDAYAVLIAAATERGRPVLLDADGAALRHGLAAGPALVTPNLAELCAVLGDDGQDGQDGQDGPDGPDWQDREEWLVESGRRMVAAGARASVVTLGPDGLLATTPDGTWHAHLPEPRPGNPTGAGDALAAVLGQGLAARRPWPDLLRDAVATSAAALARPVAGEIDPAVRARLAPTVVVEQVAPGPTATQY
jgi:tagatose 6-phosphate kinase